MGFAPEQALLPPAPHGFEGYRLLREYFAFPQRFLFFELSGFQKALSQATGDEVDLVIALDEPDTRLEGRVDKSCFDLFCAPAINLFEKTLDRVLISERFSEFHVVPDRNRPLDFEIYSVTSVTGYGETPDQERRFLPFYQARDTDLESSAFYTVHRVPRLFSDRERLTRRRSSYAGTDAFISIVDADMAPYRTDLKPARHPGPVHQPTLADSNGQRRRADDFTMDHQCSRQRHSRHPGTDFAPAQPGAGRTKPGTAADGFRPICLAPHQPSFPEYYLRRSADTGPRRRLQKPGWKPGRVCARYSSSTPIPTTGRPSSRLTAFAASAIGPSSAAWRCPGRLRSRAAWRSRCCSTRLAFEGQGVFVLGAVLEQFFAKYVSLNSFTETVVTTQQRKEIMRWPVQMGKRQIL